MKKTHVVLGIVFLIVSGLISFSTLKSLISGKEKKELVAEITSAKRESEKKEGVERALLFVEELNAIDREIKNEGAILWGGPCCLVHFLFQIQKELISGMGVLIENAEKAVVQAVCDQEQIHNRTLNN